MQSLQILSFASQRVIPCKWYSAYWIQAPLHLCMYHRSSVFNNRSCSYLSILVDDLPMKIIKGNCVFVNNPKLPYTSSSQVESYAWPQAPRTHHQDGWWAQSCLSWGDNPESYSTPNRQRESHTIMQGWLLTNMQCIIHQVVSPSRPNDLKIRCLLYLCTCRLLSSCSFSHDITGSGRAALLLLAASFAAKSDTSKRRDSTSLISLAFSSLSFCNSPSDMLENPAVSSLFRLPKDTLWLQMNQLGYKEDYVLNIHDSDHIDNLSYNEIDVIPGCSLYFKLQ